MIRNEIAGRTRSVMECKKDMKDIKEEETDVTEQKRIIRKNALAMRDSILAGDREQYDERIKTIVTNMNEYREARVILAYASYRSEVDTSALIRQALADGKNVFVPKVSGDEMEFWQITAPESLQEGYRGIPEPEENISLPEWIERQKPDSAGRSAIEIMMWMPGAVFDKERHRIGYGRGFYDRYLNRLSSWKKEICECHANTEIQLMTVALAYHCQVLERIPCEIHDIKPDMIITEKNMYYNEQIS